MGIPSSGCLRSSSWIRSLVVPSYPSILRPSVYFDLPGTTLTCVKTLSHGSFGYIDVARYETKNGVKEVYVKRPMVPGKSLLQEACVQQWIHLHLKDIGFPMGAPEVLRIFRLRDESVCFVMEPIEGATTLTAYFDNSSCFSSSMIDCLLQISAMTWYLDHTLGMNHRDLTPSNFLVVEHEPMRKILTIENEIIEISSRRSLSLIDFGFSCIGSTETHVSDLSLSTVYSMSDPCPKEGRDLYLFLGLVYIDYYDRLPPTLRTLFEGWLTGSALCRFMRKDKEHSKKWLYFMAGNEQIKRFDSRPERIVADLQSLV
jgi:serine/threonine protein kinase